MYSDRKPASVFRVPGLRSVIRLNSSIRLFRTIIRTHQRETVEVESKPVGLERSGERSREEPGEVPAAERNRHRDRLFEGLTERSPRHPEPAAGRSLSRDFIAEEE
jgi:hypothetical protein